MSCLQHWPALHIPHFSIYILAFNKINQTTTCFDQCSEMQVSMLPGSTSTAKLWPKKAFIEAVSQRSFLSHISKNEEIFIWKRSFTDKHQFVQSRPQRNCKHITQTVVVPTSRKRAFVRWLGSPASATEHPLTDVGPDVHWPHVDPDAERDSWAPCLQNATYRAAWGESVWLFEVDTLRQWVGRLCVPDSVSVSNGDVEEILLYAQRESGQSSPRSSL